MSVAVKFLVSCNLKPGREEAKTALVFLTQEFTECLREAGINRTDIWYTQYGTWPDIRMSFICQDSEALRSFLQSKEWRDLKERLLQHIEALKLKVVRSRDSFQF